MPNGQQMRFAVSFQFYDPETMTQQPQWPPPPPQMTQSVYYHFILVIYTNKTPIQHGNEASSADLLKWISCFAMRSIKFTYTVKWSVRYDDTGGAHFHCECELISFMGIAIEIWSLCTFSAFRLISYFLLLFFENGRLTRKRNTVR